MRKKALTCFFLISLLAAWFIGKAVYEPVNYLDKAEPLFEGHDPYYERISNDPIVYEVFEDEKKESFLGYLAIGNWKGYEGNVYTAARISAEGSVVKALIVEEREWRHWIQKIQDERFLEQFSNKNVTDPFYLGQDIDAVSGATITSGAITRGLRQGVHYVASAYLNLEPTQMSEPWFTYDLLLIPGLWLMAILGVLFKRTWLRWITLVLAVFLVGFMFNANVSISHLGSIMLGSTPLISMNFTWYVMILGILLTTTVLGRNIYCHWVCPFGAIQELLHLASGKRLTLSKTVKILLLNIRKILVFLVLILIFITQKPFAASYEPFATTFGFTGNALQWGIVFYALVVGAISYRFWCNNLCPVGYCINVLAGWSKAVKGKLRKLMAKEPLFARQKEEQARGVRNDQGLLRGLRRPKGSTEPFSKQDIIAIALLIPGLILIGLLILANYGIINIS